MDYEYLFRKICERRLVTLSKVESVAFRVRVDFGLPTNTELLPTVANSFYWVPDLTMITTSTYAGIANFYVDPNSGQGSVGVVALLISGTNSVFRYKSIETNSFKYVVSSHSAGGVMLIGDVFKITYTA